MLTLESVEVKSKGQVLGTFAYEYPENLEEALGVDGEDKVYKLYAQQRKIAALNAERRKLTGGGLPKAVLSALKDADPEVLQKILDQLGVEV